MMFVVGKQPRGGLVFPTFFIYLGGPSHAVKLSLASNMI